MPIYRVPRDPPSLGLSFESIVLDNPSYVMGSFNAYVDTSRDYGTWFSESSTGSINGNVLVSGGRVLGGIIQAQVASGVEWKARTEALQSRVTELEATLATREAHM